VDRAALRRSDEGPHGLTRAAKYANAARRNARPRMYIAPRGCEERNTTAIHFDALSMNEEGRYLNSCAISMTSEGGSAVHVGAIHVRDSMPSRKT
jgi:hypothetical protein